MRCNICHQDKSCIFCACGYCKECINKYGHDKCSKMEQENRKKKKEIKNE